MPIYEYRCEACTHTFEVLHLSSAAAAEPCPECGAKDPRRIMSVPSRQTAHTDTLPRPAAMAGCGGGGCPSAGGFS